MGFTKRINDKTRALVVLLKKEKCYSCAQIAAKLHVSRSSVSRIANEDERKEENKAANVWKKRGRPCLLTQRDQRKLSRSISQLRLVDPNFTAMNVVENSGIDCTKAKYRTFVSYLNKLGYKFRQTRKKGLLSETDHRRRLKYARTASKFNSAFWTGDVAFYLDGVSFVHKTNPLREAISPRARLWRKRSEGLSITAKGSKDLAGGRRLHLMVAIARKKGVICAEEYEKMSGCYFSDFIERRFPIMFRQMGKTSRTRKTFVMDNDPSQTSAQARKTLSKLGIELKEIPPRSPDLNPIENVFHAVKRQLREDAKIQRIDRETWNEFVMRVKSTILNTSTNYIDRTIESMPKRIKQIIANKGRRIKY